MQIRIKRSSLQSTITRSDYSLFQFLGDVGALYGTLEIIFNFLLKTVFQIGVLVEQKIISGVFRLRQKSKPLIIRRLKITYLDWLCSFVVCLKSRRKKLKSMARAQGLRRIERELDIVRFIRQSLMLTALVKVQTTKVQRQLLRRQWNITVGGKDEIHSTSESTCSEGYKFPPSIDNNRINNSLIANLKRQKDPDLFERANQQINQRALEPMNSQLNQLNGQTDLSIDQQIQAVELTNHKSSRNPPHT